MASRTRSLVERDSSGTDSGSISDSDSTAAGPPRAKIVRKRSLSCNPAKNVRAERCHNRKQELAKKSLWDRVREFPGEHLSVKQGRILCEV